ncbi:MAG: rhamnose ABC transporter substrate-binding protein, partial [Spirochaetes bacterium]|nr:rhamnose ABC transporter substrate-binding protein [Spirochaetota bacterium]
MRRVITKVALVIGIIAIALPMVLVGCGTTGKAKYAIVFKNTGNPYGDKQMSGFKAGIEEQGFEAILRAPDQPTAEAQIQI